MLYILTPKGYKNSIKDGSWMIKKVGYPYKQTDIGQVPVLTTDLLITKGTHPVRLPTFTNLIPI